MKGMKGEGELMKIKSEASMAPSVSIMESKRQISDIQMAIDSYGQGQEGRLVGVRNRQISSGVIIDWKQFEEREQVKSQLLLKDGQNDEKVIFSYVVEEWYKNEPAKVIYRWTRKSPKIQNKSHVPHLTEEEHVYRGPMRNNRKNGSGIYFIIKKFSDNSEKVKSIKGDWFQDILKTGVMTDETGREQILSSNILKISMRSKKVITPFLEKNHVIEEMKKKSMHMIPSGKYISGVSSKSIREKFE